MEQEEVAVLESLINRHSGVMCPGCKDEVFSTSTKKYASCSCGVTRVIGSIKYLQYFIGVPYDLSDVQIISRSLGSVEEESSISREAVTTVDVCDLESLIQDELGVQAIDPEDLVQETEEATPEVTPE